MEKCKSNIKKNKKALSTEKNRNKLDIQWDREHAYADGILLIYNYNKFIKYDYILPEPYRICKIIRKLLKEIKVTESFKDVILDFITYPNDHQSRLESYMDIQRLFGNEWFYGVGTLYRWRVGEQAKAEDRYYKYVPLEDRECFDKLAEKIRLISYDEIDKILLDN